jgi:hypothetical protein
MKASAIVASILDDRNFISFAELKELTNHSKNTIYKLSDEGILTRIRVKGKAYFHADEVKSYLIGKGGSIT